MSASEKKFLTDIFVQILRAAHPENIFSKYLHMYEDQLYYRNKLIPYSREGRIVLAGSGKAALSMAKSFLQYLPQQPDDTLLITPPKRRSGFFNILYGDHPLPGSNSLNAGKYMLDLLDDLDEGDTLFYVLSGGSSALFEYPAESISPEDLTLCNKLFLARGLNIHEINYLRTRLSMVKGGRLAERCAADCHIFLLSDVMGNDISVIGSGPFAPVANEGFTVNELLHKYHLEDDLPAHIQTVLQNNAAIQSTRSVPHYLCGSNMDLLEIAAGMISKRGIATYSFPESLFGEACDTGSMIADMINNFKGPKPACLLFGGETTVTLRGDTGMGGRSQETALAALKILQDKPGYALLCGGSDGIDGPTDAAGAMVDDHTYLQAKDCSISISEHLSRHDAYHFHEQCGSLIITGASGTNLGDIALGFIF